MTQPSQEPPTIPKRGEFSQMSGQETILTMEGDGDPDSDKDVQVRPIADTIRRVSIADLYVSLWYRLNLRRQRSSSKRETIYFVMASGTRRYKAIGVGWLDFRREIHHRLRHEHQPPTRKAIHPLLKGRLLVPPQMSKINTNPPDVSILR
jgi:hypothetical protein